MSRDLIVSVIILNFNGERVIGRCIDSVLKTDYPNFEVIIVDNCSSDDSVKIIDKYKGITLIRLSGNLGYSSGNNVGARVARGSINVFLNNDAVVEPNWLNEVVAAFKDPLVGIVGCRVILMKENVIQTVGMAIVPSGHSKTIGFGEPPETSYPELLEVDFVSGVALAIRRELFEHFQFDPIFFSYYEDADLCLNVRENGYKIFVATKAIVFHDFSFSWNNFFFRKILLNERNRLIFIKKHFLYAKQIKALSWETMKFDVAKITEALSGGLASSKIAKGPNNSNNPPSSFFKEIIAYVAARLIMYPLLFFDSLQIMRIQDVLVKPRSR